MFTTFGINWEHQLSKRVSTVLGVFTGFEYMEVENDGTEWGYYYGGYRYSYHEEADDFGLMVGASLGLNIAISERHSIELGVDAAYSSMDFGGGRNKFLHLTGRLGYTYHF